MFFKSMHYEIDSDLRSDLRLRVWIYFDFRTRTTNIDEGSSKIGEFLEYYIEGSSNSMLTFE